MNTARGAKTIEVETIDLKCCELRCVEIETAARDYLDALCNMASDDFARSADRAVRWRLVRALGLKWSDYGLGSGE